MHKWFIQNIVNKTIWPILGSKRISLFHTFQKKQWEPIEKNLDKQKKELYAIVKYSIENIPYYRKIAKNNNITISEKTIYQDIQKIPPLTKKVIREHRQELINTKLLKQAKKNTSGGTTGEPITLLQDTSYLDYNSAATALCDEWGRRTEGNYVLKLWGSERDTAKGSQGIRGFLVKLFLNEELVNTFSLDENKIKEIVDIIQTKKPSTIISYVQSIEQVADYIYQNNISFTHKCTIITSAGTLYPEVRKKIEKAFACKVLNRYGSREVGLIASECEQQSGLHLCTYNNYVEILDSKLQNIKNGKTGEIYVTNLHNKVMPLIRYQLGDRVTTASKNCSCQRGLPTIQTVKGRTVDVFINKKGDLIDGEYFTHLFYHQEWLQQFQVVQKETEVIEIYVVVKNQSHIKNKENIEEGIQKVMGKNCKIVWKKVKTIPKHKNGKFSFTISEVKK
jgi:phenylacetate-CoA ligase